MAVSDPEFRERRLDGPGRRLRRAREKRGLSQSQAADALRLDRGTIEAIEADDFDRLPPVTFVRGYIKAYAQWIGLPEEDVLGAFNAAGFRESERPLTASVGRRPGGGGAWAGAVLVLALVGLLAGGGWFAWQSGLIKRLAPPGMAWLDAPAGDADDAAAEDADFAVAASGRIERGPDAGRSAEDIREPEESTAADVVSDSGDTAEPESAAETDAGDTADGDGDASRPDATAESQPGSTRDPQPIPEDAVATREPATAPSEPSPGTGTAAGPRADSPEARVERSEVLVAEVLAGDQAEGEGAGAAANGTDAVVAADLETLRFQFRGESWMEVTDARGERLLFGLINDTEREEVEGVAPFEIVIGDVARVTLHHEGDAVALEPHTRGQVARLTVGEEDSP